jgi:hypothetical protein
MLSCRIAQKDLIFQEDFEMPFRTITPNRDRFVLLLYDCVAGSIFFRSLRAKRLNPCLEQFLGWTSRSILTYNTGTNLFYSRTESSSRDVYFQSSDLSSSFVLWLW